MSESIDINNLKDSDGVPCDVETKGEYFITVNGVDGAEVGGSWTSDTFVIVILGSFAQAVLQGEPEEVQPLTGDTLLTMIKRLKAENTSLKADNAELTRLFGDRVQDSEVAARAVADERLRLIAAVRAMSDAKQSAGEWFIAQKFNAIAKSLESLT